MQGHLALRALQDLNRKRPAYVRIVPDELWTCQVPVQFTIKYDLHVCRFVVSRKCALFAFNKWSPDSLQFSFSQRFTFH